MINFAQLMQLEWAHPWWGLLALQPVLMALLLKLRRNQVMHYADAHLLAWAVRGNTDLKQGGWRALVNIIAWLLLAIAVAGPRLPLPGDTAQQGTPRHEMDIMVILDVSPSMLGRDISPQRLQRARLELLDLLPRLHGERLGLIAFSGSAGMLMPLSRDYEAMRYYLQLADTSLFDAQGTALAAALDLAQRKMPAEQRAILLLTDAESSALSGPAGAAVWEAADKLKTAGIGLYILATGTAEGSTITMPDGNTLVDEGADVVSRLDANGFGALAKKTAGKFVTVEDGDADWRTLYDNGLFTLPGGKQPLENVQAWQTLYAGFLLPALLLFALLNFNYLFNTIKHLKICKYLAVYLFSGVLFMLPGAHEVQASESEAYAAYRSQNHALAQTLYGELTGYNARMGEGAAAYRRKDYQYAIRQFSNALLESRETYQREQALFNLGNSYFMANAYRAAADAFLGVLRYAPDNQNARANLALAAGKLAGMRQPGKKPNGVAGRRGRDTGGGMGDDATDQPLAMDESADKKDRRLGVGSELSEAEKARLNVHGKVTGASSTTELDRDLAYRAALKKLELANDNPLALHKALIKIEASRDYVPQLEMPPW